MSDLVVSSQSFKDLGVSEKFIKTLDRLEFFHPTPIQAQVIPEALQGRDILGCAQTGTGKTGAFCLPLLESLKKGVPFQGLILSPTREIAEQTHTFLNHFQKDQGIKNALIIGGTRYRGQEEALSQKPEIIVATPGRLMDHVERGRINLKALKYVILDEADRMLDMGFYPQIEQVFAQIKGPHRTQMFSATMPPRMESLAERHLEDPVTIKIAPPGTSAVGIDHRLYLVEEKHRNDVLLQLVREEPGSVLIFARMKRDVDYLTKFLQSNGEDAHTIHSDKSQSQRRQALEALREGGHVVLVATDLLARGVDVKELSRVISYQVPENAEDYIHRSGRTGRYDAKGVSCIIGTWKDKAMLATVERLLGEKLARCTADGIPAYKEPRQRVSRLRG